MKTYGLSFTMPTGGSQLLTSDFLWRRSDNSSFHTSLTPRLEQLGPVPELHSDFVRLATLVYLTDRTSPRPLTGEGNRWERELHLAIPVSDPELWRTESTALEGLLGFLSGDTWQLDFNALNVPRARRVAGVRVMTPACLFSGGADSLAGAVMVAHEQQSTPTLVSHWDNSAVSNAQKQLRGALGVLWGEMPAHVRVHIGRRAKQVGSGESFPREPSSRSRSLLFIAIGIAAAAVRDTELLMPENGFASLNVPLAGERRGSLSTRTTHPALLDHLTATLNRLGLNVRLRNPFEMTTKGEMFTQVASVHGKAAAAKLLSRSHSCATTDANYHGFSPSTHCGVCFGCLVRRSAFLASDLPDSTAYIEELLRGDSKRDKYLTQHRRKTYETLRYRVSRGVSEADIITLGLPARMDLDDALNLVQRGLDELALVVIP